MCYGIRTSRALKNFTLIELIIYTDIFMPLNTVLKILTLINNTNKLLETDCSFQGYS